MNEEPVNARVWLLKNNLEMRRRFHRESREFRITFGLNLREYEDKLNGIHLGFDILRFNEYLVDRHGYDPKSNTESMRDFVMAKFGERAVAMIERLLDTATVRELSAAKAGE